MQDRYEFTASGMIYDREQGRFCTNAESIALQQHLDNERTALEGRARDDEPVAPFGSIVVYAIAAAFAILVVLGLLVGVFKAVEHSRNATQEDFSAVRSIASTYERNL